MKRARSIVPARCLALILALVVSRSSGAAPSDICEDRSVTVSDAFAQRGLKEHAAEASKAELGSRATSDGLAEGDLDLIRRAFVALDLGSVEEEKDSLVFNFNPDALNLDDFGQFSPRVTVHAAKLHGALDKAIDGLDESIRQDRRDALEETLGDLDDVEYSLRWTPSSMRPAADLQQVADTLFAGAESPLAALANQLAELKGRIAEGLTRDVADDPTLSAVSVGEVCDSPRSKDALLAALAAIDAQLDKQAKVLETRLGERFFRLADLVEGQPRFVATVNARQRGPAAGPDEKKLAATYTWGWISYRGASKFAQDRARKNPRSFPDGSLTVDSVDAYFEQYGRLKGALPRFTGTAEYSETDDLAVPLVGSALFTQDGGHKLTAKLTAGWYFGGGRDRRLALTASYDDVSGDPTLQDRFVADLTWTEQLGEAIARAVGGSEFVVSLVYADKPEHRGEVDKDLGLRAGLKWSLGKAEDQ